MRLLAIVFCLSLMGCGPVMRYSVNPNALYSVNGAGVNMGSYRPVTEVNVIHGDIWIY